MAPAWVILIVTYLVLTGYHSAMTWTDPAAPDAREWDNEDKTFLASYLGDE